MEKSAAVGELKANLSRYLRRVKAGETILVTERNAAIARLVPVRAAEDGDERLRQLERVGLATTGSGRLPKDFWKLPRGKDEKGRVRSAVLEERKEGW